MTSVHRSVMLAACAVALLACDVLDPPGEGVWRTLLSGRVTTAAGAAVAGAEVKGFFNAPQTDWGYPDAVDTTDANGVYLLDLGVFGGGSGCNDDAVDLQIVRFMGDDTDTTRITGVPVSLCIDRASEDEHDVVLNGE